MGIGLELAPRPRPRTKSAALYLLILTSTRPAERSLSMPTLSKVARCSFSSVRLPIYDMVLATSTA